MAVKQPWPLLRKSVCGLDRLWLDPGSSPAANGHGVVKKGKSRATETVITQLGWAMLNEGLLSPIGILHSDCVLAFAIFTLVIAMVDQVCESEALASAAEVAHLFGLDIEFDDEAGAKGEDLESVKGAMRQYVRYCESGLIDPGLVQYIVVGT